MKPFLQKLSLASLKTLSQRVLPLTQPLPEVTTTSFYYGSTGETRQTERDVETERQTEREREPQEREAMFDKRQSQRR